MSLFANFDPSQIISSIANFFNPAPAQRNAAQAPQNAQQNSTPTPELQKEQSEIEEALVAQAIALSSDAPGQSERQEGDLERALQVSLLEQQVQKSLREQEQSQAPQSSGSGSNSLSDVVAQASQPAGDIWRLDITEYLEENEAGLNPAKLLTSRSLLAYPDEVQDKVFGYLLQWLESAKVSAIVFDGDLKTTINSTLFLNALAKAGEKYHEKHKKGAKISLKLCAANIVDADSQVISDMLRKQTIAKSLDLKNNKLTACGLKEIAKALNSYAHELSSFNIQGNPIGKEGLEILRGVRKFAQDKSTKIVNGNVVKARPLSIFQ